MTWFRRCALMPLAAMSRPVVTVIHEPDRALRIPDTRQPDAIARSAASPNSGVWYPAVTLPTCVRFCSQLPRSKSGSSGFRKPELICG